MDHSPSNSGRLNSSGKRREIPKSVSTTQLLGDLYQVGASLQRKKERVARAEEEDETDYESSSDTQVVVDISTSLLTCIQHLRRVICHYTYGPMGRELHQLSLTVAAYERVLFTFIKEELLHGDADFRNKSALKDAVPMIDHAKPHPLLKGGLGSLLRHSIGNFKETTHILENLHHSKHREAYSYSKKAGSLLSAGIALYLARKYYTAPSKWKFLRQSLSPASFKKWIMIFMVFHWSQKLSYRFSYVRKIKICHTRISLTFRLLILCLHIVQRSRIHRTSSKRLLIDSPCQADIDDNMKNAFVLLIQRVPLPAEYYRLASNDANLSFFKNFLSVAFASSGTAHALIGRYPALWNRFAYVVMLALFPFYISRLNQAARYATRLHMDKPNIEILRKAWGLVGDSCLSVFVHEHFLAPKIPLRQEMFVEDARGDMTKSPQSSFVRRKPTDIPVRVFSMRPIASIVRESWEGASQPLSEKLAHAGLPRAKPILFYIHGGGFMASFIAMDILNLSKWAEELGATIVYPEYGLSPEHPYPYSLNQCLQTYQWATNGGLGFIPTKVVVFGESAGGNIASAMLLKLAQAPYKDTCRQPDGLVLVHPALNCYVSPSPSRFLHQNDPILPRGILELALNSYDPDHGHIDQYAENIHDPFVSPGTAPDAMLLTLPRTTLLVGGLDPLLDDSIDFNTRIRRVGVKGKLYVMPRITHGFLTCGMYVPDAQTAIDKISEILFNMLHSQD